MDQVPLPREHSIDGISEVPRDLVHPQAIGERCDAGDLHLAGSQVDEEQNHEPLQSLLGPDLYGEEVRRDDQVPMPLQELLPRRLSIALRRRLDPMPFQDRRDRTMSDLVPRVGQGSLDAPIAPIAILPGQSHDQSFEFAGSARPARSSFAAPVVLLGDQLAVPGEQGLRRHDGSDFREDGPSQPFGLGGQPAPLIVCEARTLAAELFPEDSIFFAQVLDYLQLALAHPAGDREQEEPEWIQQFRHLVDPLSKMPCVQGLREPQSVGTEGGSKLRRGLRRSSACRALPARPESSPLWWRAADRAYAGRHARALPDVEPDPNY